MTSERFTADFGATEAFRRVLESAHAMEPAAPSVIVLASPSGRWFRARCSVCGPSRWRADRTRAVEDAEAHACVTHPVTVLVASRAKRGAVYHVAFGLDDGACCSCAAWEFHAVCPHIAIAKQRRSAA